MTDQAQDIADSIKEALKDVTNAEVRINPTVQAIPPQIAHNLLQLLQRVQVTGQESIAWVEAYQYLQSQAPQQGVPFTGLPSPKA